MATAKEKQKAVEFSHDYGIRAAADAWDKSVSTIYNWRKRFREGGKLALKDRSRCSQMPRKRKWDQRIIQFIRVLRNEHPGLGQDKIHVLMEPFCQEHQLPLPSPRTIARMIQNDPLKSPHLYRKAPRTHTTISDKTRKPKDFEPRLPAIASPWTRS